MLLFDPVPKYCSSVKDFVTAHNTRIGLQQHYTFGNFQVSFYRRAPFYCVVEKEATILFIGGAISRLGRAEMQATGRAVSMAIAFLLKSVLYAGAVVCTAVL